MKLPATFATDVFINMDHGLSISQDVCDGGEDVVVALSRDQARRVAAEIMRLDGDDAAWEVKEED